MQDRSKAEQLLEKLRTDPTSVQFQEVIEAIEAGWSYTPTAFTNGGVSNEAGTNEGSCKILSFAQISGLDTEETLQLFGDFYRTDVLENPQGDDHGNIRSFMQTGWDGVSFEGQALSETNP
jgi:hypothetical protein